MVEDKFTVGNAGNDSQCFNQFELSEDENINRFIKRILPIYSAQIYSVPFPRIAIVAGQPGSGKSFAIKILKGKMGLEFLPVTIDKDELALSHPKLSEIQEFDNLHMSEYTNTDANKWKRYLLKLCEVSNSNVIFEHALQRKEFIEETICQFKESSFAVDLHCLAVNSKISIQNIKLAQTAQLIDRHENGIILVGRGGRAFSAQVKELSRKIKWPIISTVHGKGTIEHDFENYVGNYGFLGTDSAKAFVDSSQATCLLVLGSSLSELVVRNQNDPLLAGKEIIQIDSDSAELNKIYNVSCPVHADLKTALPYLINHCMEKSAALSFPREGNNPYEKNHTGLSLRKFVENLPDLIDKKMYFISDIGEYMNFVFKYFPIKNDAKLEVDAAYGAMGYGVGGALGAHLADTDRQTVVLCGDGGFFMNGMEILTAKEYGAPIVYFVVNNSMLGYIVKLQSIMYGRESEGAAFQNISISKLCEAMGVKSMTITRNEDFPAITPFIRDLNGPCVVELITDGSEKSGVEERAAALKGTNTLKQPQPNP